MLRRRADPEVERRLALSLAISGQRDAALRVIDGQLRRHDRAAWRTQAFVLALTGDARGAEDTAGRMMPAANAQEMAPFFARLPSLSPAQKAAAVHFGRFPSDGRAAQVASSADTRADPGALALARNEPIRARPQPRRAAQRGAAPPPRRRGRPGRELDRRGSARGRAAPVRAAAARAEPDEAKPEERSERAAAGPVPSAARGARLRPRRRLHPGARRRPAARGAGRAAAGARPRQRLRRRRRAGPVVARRSGRRPGARRRGPRASARPAARFRASGEPEPHAPAANPARHWVQLAHASAQSVLPREFSRGAGRGAGPARQPHRLCRPHQPRQPAAGRPVRQRARRPGLRQPARTAPCRGNCLDKPGGPGDRAAPDSE